MRYAFGDYVLDTELYRLECQGEGVRLPPRAYQMLVYLLEKRQRVVRRQELFEQVWADQYVSDAALESCIKQVRQAVGDSGRRQHVIQTVHGHGYRFIAFVREVADVTVTTASEVVIPSCDALPASPSESPPLPPSATVSAAPPAVTVSTSPPEALPREPERRQLTVLSCVLAESEVLTQRLDADDLHEVLRAFHALGTEAVQPYGGYVAQRTEDSFVLYFGYPRAHDDDARRAVLAGLQLAEAVSSRLVSVRLLPEFPLAVRIGIHSGPVVVWVDASDAQPTVLAAGSTSAIATALRELAAPPGVVISGSTATLVAGYFTCQSLAPYQPGGQREALAVYQITGESQAQIRLDLVAPGRQTPFVGRESELALLDERWVQVASSQGQAVVVQGEAGIGKSRLVRTLAERLLDNTCTALEGRGSPYHQQSAFYPLRHLLEQVFHLDERTGADTAIGQADTTLQEAGLNAQQHLPFLTPLLDLNLPEERYPVPSLSPQQRRQYTLASLTELFVALADTQPVLLVVEDLHWVDPSTLEWLGVLLDQVPTRRLLLLLTSRPEFDHPWSSRSYLTQLTLNRLTPQQSQRMVEVIVGDRPLSAPVIEQIVAHSDGVPLFIEELTRSVLDSGATTTIPCTLHEVLMARLDQVGEAKRTAQLGSVMGREFSYALLDAVSSLAEPTLQGDLRRLVEGELLYQRGVGNDAVYLFKHALIQDVAYQSLLRRTRQHYHQRIAQVLEEQFPESKVTQPEVLAHHYTEAGLYAQALPYWQQAGNRAIDQSAYTEGIAYLSRALALLEVLPDTLLRRHTELDVQLTLANAFHCTKGRNSPEVLRVSTRARELCERIGDTSKLIQALARLRIFHMQSGDLPKALELAEEIARLAQQTRDLRDQIRSDFSLGVVLLNMGALRDAQAHFARGAALGERLRSGIPGSSCETFELYCRGSNLLALSVLGYADQAREQAHETLRQAQERNHPFGLASTLISAAKVYLFCRDASTVAELAASQMALCREHGLAIEPEGRALHGWALVQQGEQARGLMQIRQVLDVESKMNQLLHLMLFADACRMTGKIEEGMQTLARARELVEQTQIRWHEAELYRLQGELLLAQSLDNDMEAESCFHHALDIARQQQAKAREVRAAISLSRLWQQQGRQQDAYDLLAPAYDWFTEGFDTADLQEAKAFLKELET